MADPKKYHPLTGALIVPLGYRKDGRPIWPIMGAADPAPTPTPDPQPTPPSDPAPTPPADPPADPKPDEGKGGKDAILADLAKERDARQALQQQITDMQTAQQEQMDALAKALGLKKDDAPADPAALAAQIETEKAATRQAAAQLAVYRAAGAHEANPDALLDSASFLASIADLDPTDAAKIGDAIKAAVEKNPALKATPATPSFQGGPRKPTGQPDPGPGLARLRDAYEQSSK